uniref:Leucine-rich PPR motif-containing protein, mitochondrial n=1 Tax=Haemonchus contortus TaxID=6289 RepID=A0A7I5EDQ8_HAECO
MRLFLLLRTKFFLRSPKSWRHCSSVPIPYCSTPKTGSFACDDNRLINREDFRGVPARNEKKARSRFPETVLAKIQESLKKNYRISASTIFLDVVRRLEEDDEAFVSTLKRSSDRWLPMLFRACGSASSNVPNSSRQQILARLWKQIDSKGVKVDTNCINALLSSLLEIDCIFDSFKVLKDMEEKRKLEPDQHTFEILLSNIARKGNAEGCRAMVYEMARRGFVLNQACNDALVYCFAVRGHYAKADSLAEQALGKYGADAVSSSQGACAKAAAARADLNRLRTVLRRAVMGEERKLILSSSDVLETIWLLAEKSRYGDGAEYVNLTEQMLNHTNHQSGYFRMLIREVERHISHQHYYTAIALLEDTNKIVDCLRNQQKSLFLDQMISQLSRQVIRNEVSVVKLNDIANRVVAVFKNHPNAPRIHDDLLFAAVMYKNFSMDKRMEYVSALLDMVDRDRTRPHLILPLLASADNVDERLKIIFRCCNAGYKDLSELDIPALSHLVLQPLYDNQRITRGGQSKLDKFARILRSFGVSNESIWKTMYAWWQDRDGCEKRTADLSSAPRPYASDLQLWLRQHYAETFEVEKRLKAKLPPIQATYEKLKKFVDERDSSKVHAFLTSYGWPEKTDFEEIIPDVLGLYLDHEPWGNVKRMLISLSAQSERWQKEDDPSYSPIKNYHLLQVLRRFSIEGDEISLPNMTNYAFELRRLFPGAVSKYETFFNSMHEYNRLFGKCFERLPNPSVEMIDECIDFLRTLIKLEILQLHPNETLTCVFIGHVLKKLGWEEAVNTWMKFQSGLYCSNGIVALLLYCLAQKSDNSKRNIQYVLHKAQNFLHQSRVHCLYAAVLVAKRQYEEAATFLEEHKDEIDPLDCVMAMRFMNSFKARMIDEEFIRQFAELCLKHTKFVEDLEAIRQMQVDWIRTCEQRKLAPLGLRLYDLFKRYGVNLENDEKVRLWKLVGEHELLAKRWIYEPEGFLKIRADDDLIRSTDIYQIQQVLKNEVPTLRSSAS